MFNFSVFFSDINFLQTVEGVKDNKPLFYLENKELHFSSEYFLYVVNPLDFWEGIKNFHSEKWEDLFLGFGQRVSREVVEEWIKLNLEIPPYELLTDFDIPLESLKMLVKEQIPPMHVAAYCGSVTMLKNYFEKGEDLNFILENKGDFYKSSPLTIAFSKKNLKAFVWLLEKKGSFAAFDSFECPLESSLSNQREELFARLLVEHGYLKHQISKSPSTSFFHRAVINGDIKRIAFILDVNKKLLNLNTSLKETPLYLAVKNKHYALTEYLILCGADLNAVTFRGQTPVWKASDKNNVEMLALLLKNGAFFEFDEFEFALKTKNFQQIKLFLDHARNMKMEAVFDLLESCWKEWVIELIHGGLDINICDERGTPLFHHVVQSEDCKLINNLLEFKNLDKKATDAKGLTPLHLATCMGKKYLVELLIDHGFDVKAEADSKITPLHIAVHRGDEKMAKLFIEKGADVLAKDARGVIPLSLAFSIKGYGGGLAHLLMSNGANISIPAPNVICELHKQGRIPYFSELYKKLDKKLRCQKNEELIRKLCAHAIERGGISYLIKREDPSSIVETIKLTGMKSDRWLHHYTIKELEKPEIKSLFSQEFCLTLKEALQFSKESFSKLDLDYFNRIQEEKLTFLFSGWNTHGVQIVFHKNRLGIVDRNGSLQFFYYEKLTQKIIHKLRSLKTKNQEIFKDQIEKITKKLKIENSDEFISFVKKSYPLEKQITGNCVFASHEGALFLGIVSLLSNETERESVKESVNKGVSLFLLLQLHKKLWLTLKYFNSHLEHENPFRPDMKLAQALMQEIEKTSFTETHPFYHLYVSVMEKYVTLDKLFSGKQEKITIDVDKQGEIEVKVLDYKDLVEEYYC